MIHVRGLTKKFGSTLAVDNLSFDVRPGIVTGFLGPNGAGKSTTMRMMLGLDIPDSGSALIDGRRYVDLKKPLTTVGSLLDAGARHPKRSARNHLRWIAAANNLPERRVNQVLKLVGLSDQGSKPAGGFSLGMGQRLGLAVALLGDPAYLVLDEPINGLDPQGIKWVRDLLRSLAAEGRGVLVSSHLLSEMSMTADHLVVIGRGRLIADMPTQEFVARNSQSTVVVRTPEPQRLHDLFANNGIMFQLVQDANGKTAFELNGIDPDQIGDLAYCAGIPLSELTQRRASLEEAFMHMTDTAVQYRAGER